MYPLHAPHPMTHRGGEWFNQEDSLPQIFMTTLKLHHPISWGHFVQKPGIPLLFLVVQKVLSIQVLKTILGRLFLLLWDSSSIAINEAPKTSKCGLLEESIFFILLKISLFTSTFKQLQLPFCHYNKCK